MGNSKEIRPLLSPEIVVKRRSLDDRNKKHVWFQKFFKVGIFPSHIRFYVHISQYIKVILTKLAGIITMQHFIKWLC